jgi:hypothetical protein
MYVVGLDANTVYGNTTGRARAYSQSIYANT